MASLENCREQITALTLLVEQEKQVLKSGQLALISGLSERKAEALTLLTKTLAALDDSKQAKVLEVELLTLQKQSRQNGIMLQSVFYGVKSARERIEKIKSQQAQVGAYGPKGNEIYFHEDPVLREKSI